MTARLAGACFAVVALGLFSCGPAPSLRGRFRLAGVSSPRRVGTGETALVNLGQLLFFDPELSGNRNIACGTCHVPERHAGDGRFLAVGENGDRLWRQTIEPFNAGYRDALFWDGRVWTDESGDFHIPNAELPSGIQSLMEAQALLPLLDRSEMRGQDGDVAADGRPNELAAFGDDETAAIWAAILARVLSYPGYQEAFALAYPSVALDELSIVHLVRAITAFETFLWELADSQFDTFLGTVTAMGFDGALDPNQTRGAELFVGEAGCITCHDGPLFSDGLMHNIGVPLLGEGRGADGLDEGRMEVTGDPADRFAFRTAPLRNVALTGPWMHNGAYQSLEDAIRHHVDPEAALASYDASRLPADVVVARDHFGEVMENLDPGLAVIPPLSEQDIQALAAFLFTLSSNVEINVAMRPDAGIPRVLPSGLDVILSPGDPGR